MCTYNIVLQIYAGGEKGKREGKYQKKKKIHYLSLAQNLNTFPISFGNSNDEYQSYIRRFLMQQTTIHDEYEFFEVCAVDKSACMDKFLRD